MSWFAFGVVVAAAAWLEESETRKAEMVATATLLAAVLAFVYVVGVH